MNIQYAFEHINQKVFKTIRLENIAIKEATRIKNTYPYFIFVRYILAYKEKELFQNITLEAALQRDPLWFGYVLEHMNQKSEIPNTNFSTTTSIYHAHTLTIENEKIVLPMLDISLPTHTKDIPNPLVKKNEAEIPVVNENNILSTIDTQTISINEDTTKLSKEENSIELPIVDNNIILPTIDTETILINENTTKFSKEESIIELPIVDEIPEFSSTSTTPSNKAISEQEDEPIIATPDKTTTPFMPLHVEDYFGALNISVKEPIHTTTLPINKPSKNQKPFMDWLDDFSHSYKKNNLGGSSDKNDTPVASETMAEIWVAENRYDKAINTYEKLSLLFPEKSVYFAKKISELKNTLK